MPTPPRALAVVIVRSAEAPRNLAEFEINAQLPSLGRVLTAGYRRQVCAVPSRLSQEFIPPLRPPFAFDTFHSLAEKVVG